MSEVSNKLRMMLAAEHMHLAIRKALPLMRERAAQMSATASAFPERGYMQKESDKWVEATMVLELALKAALPLTDTPKQAKVVLQ